MSQVLAEVAKQIEVVKVLVRLRSPEFERRYGSDNYAEIREEANEDFWGNIAQVVGPENPSEDHFAATEDFIAQLRQTNGHFLIKREAEFEYLFGGVRVYQVPVGIPEDVAMELNEEKGKGSLESRAERLLARNMARAGFPTVIKYYDRTMSLEVVY